MRKYSNISFAVMLLLTLSFLSCKKFPGASVTAKPDPIEVHADSIKYEITAVIPPKSGFKKAGVYTGEAKIGSFSQGRVVVSSERYPSIKKVGMDTTVRFIRAYDDKMDGNDLMISQKYERKAKTFELPPIEELAQCCITTSRLVWENYQYLWLSCDNKYQPKVEKRLEAKFNFPKDVFKIQENEYNKADIVAIGQFLAEKNPATSISIVGFASPEGPYERNVMLSKNRSKEVQEWLTGKLKEAGYEQYLDSTFFKIKVTHEDWDGFKASINAGPYSPDVKKQIIEIVSAGLSEDERERQVMALVGGKDKVEHILAPLRRATIVVEGLEKRKTNEEIDKIAQDFAAGKFNGKIKDTYEKEEWMFAICRQKDFKVKRALLEAFRDAYPSDRRAFNDLGAIALMDGDKETGLDLLEKASKLQGNDPAVQNNYGVALLMNKKYKDAKTAFETSLASKSTPEANYNLGIVLEKMGMYTSALEKFNAASKIQGSDYNAGLCKLLLNDVNGAKASLGESAKKETNHAWTHYVMAITGAHSNDISTLSFNLKKACDLDSSLKAKAKKDLEFRKYWNNAEFKAATN